jgi:hypothetical protein
MSYRDLAMSMADGEPGSPDWQHGLAILQTRSAVEEVNARAASQDAAHAGRLTAEATAKLVDQTSKLQRGTWCMAAATLILAVVSTIGLFVR